jgi:hypothetical protein
MTPLAWGFAIGCVSAIVISLIAIWRWRGIFDLWMRAERERDEARTAAEHWKAHWQRSSQERSDALCQAADWQAKHAALAEQLAIVPQRDPATGRYLKR